MQFLNCLFLIVGTTIGTGILALPLVHPQNGFMPTLISLVTTWGFMTLSSFMLLRAILIHKAGEDFIAIAKKKLGDLWQVAIGASYLLLFYSLLAVYILVGSSWLHELTKDYMSLSVQHYYVIFTALAALLIYLGVHFVGGVNQLLSAGVIITLLSVITLGAGKIDSNNLAAHDFSEFYKAMPLMITAFGFAIIFPTLATYTNKNRKILFQSLGLASIIIISLNILWVAICFGVIGSGDLSTIANKSSEGTEVVFALQQKTKNSSVGAIAEYFAIFALLSSLIGVSLSLYHFILDSFKLKKTKYYKINGITLTFLVPLLALLINPSSFVGILSFAGVFVSVVLGIFPAMLEINNHKKSKETLDIILRYLAYISIVFYAYIILIELINLCK